MAKPPKIVIPGLNRGQGVPPGYIVGRLPASGKGPAQLLNLTALRKLGVAAAAGVTQSTSQAISIATSEVNSLSTAVSTAISGITHGSVGLMFGLDGDDGLDGYPIPGPQGPTGPIGPMGPQGTTGIGLDGEDGSDGYPIPGPPGAPGAAGAAGAVGPQGPMGFALDGADGEDTMPIPGPPGPAGAAGAIGPIGPQGPIGFGMDGEDGQDDLTVPGTPGAPGATGATGATGPQGPIGFGLDGQDGDDGMPIPGPQGPQGPAGPTGSVGPQGPIGWGMDGEDGQDGLMIPSPSGSNGADGGTYSPLDQKVPASSSFSTTFNSPIVTDHPQIGLHLTGANGGTALRCALKTLSGDKTIIVRLNATITGGNTSAGIMVRNSTSGKCVSFGPCYNGGNVFNSLEWSSTTGAVADITDPACGRIHECLAEAWLRQFDDGPQRLVFLRRVHVGTGVQREHLCRSSGPGGLLYVEHKRCIRLRGWSALYLL